MKHIVLIIFILIALNLQAYTGRVIKVIDGDTITILNNNKQIKIRLYGIDAPEKKQPYGNKAKQFLSKFIFNKMVDIEPFNTDRYGRVVAIITYSEVKGNSYIINEELIKNGMAWVYEKYCKEPYKYKWLILQEKAKINKIGLWTQNNPNNPEDFRKHNKKSHRQKANGRYYITKNKWRMT